jgi:hypothetical protein
MHSHKLIPNQCGLIKRKLKKKKKEEEERRRSDEHLHCLLYIMHLIQRGKKT